MNRIVGSDRETDFVTLHFPGVIGSPALLTVFRRRVFEVAVLDQFAVETTVGSIVDILKEDTHQQRRDLLCRAGSLERALQRLKTGEALLVAVGMLRIESMKSAALSREGIKLGNHLRGDVHHVARDLLTVYLSHGRKEALVGAEGELRGVGRSVIFLRLPLHEVGRFGHSYHLPFRVGTEKESPPSGRGGEKLRAPHLLEAAPGAKIGAHEVVAVANRTPRAIGLLHGEAQTPVAIFGRIEEKVGCSRRESGKREQTG